MTLLTEIKDRLAMASPGKWTASNVRVLVGNESLAICPSFAYEAHSLQNQASRNAEFIASAPEYIAKLVECVELQNEAIAEVIRNSGDIIAKKRCSEILDKISKILTRGE